MIFAVANPALAIPKNKDEGLVQLFLLMTQEAWRLFIKIGGLLIKYVKTGVRYLVKLIMANPYTSMFLVFASGGLIILYYLLNKFGKKLTNRITWALLIIILLWALYLFVDEPNS